SPVMITGETLPIRGLAQLTETMLSSVPLIGGLLGGVGWAPALASGAIGIGGAILGDYIHRHYDRKGHIQWGTVIKYAALTTSVLISLPSILSGISMGISYISGLFNGGLPMGGVTSFMGSTFGFSGIAHTAPTGLAGLAPHLFTCGRALLPVGAALLASRKAEKAAQEPTYDITMWTRSSLLAGTVNEVAFQLIDHATGRALTDGELQTLHTKKLHTMIVDSSLSDYHHLHPVYDAKRQLFVARFTPKLSGSYSMWNDFTVAGDAGPTYLKTVLKGGFVRGLAPSIHHANQVRQGDMDIRILHDQPLRAGLPATLTVEIRDRSGALVRDLEPIMGAYAHLVGFSGDGEHAVHTHPLGDEPLLEEERGVGRLQFHVVPPAGGFSKFFLQVQRGGQVMTIPFGQAILSNLAYGERLYQPTPRSYGHAMA
ncbi:MAG: hypothetical protein ACOYNL_00910, partial [Rickettsiales bacterium]